MIWDVFKKLALLTAFYAAIFFALRLYYGTDTIFDTFTAAEVFFYPYVLTYLGIAFGIVWREKAWFQLRSQFRGRLKGEFASSHVAFGFFELEEEEEIVVVTMAIDDGIAVLKPKRKLHPRHAFLIPWSDIEKVYVWQPKRLEACRSSDDCRALAQELKAEVAIGGLSRTKLNIPWHYDFNRLAPPHVDLQMSWTWPYPI